MYRNLFTAMLLIFTGYHGLAQQTQNLADIEKIESHQVQTWIKENPQVKLVSLGHFQYVSQGERDELVNLSIRLLHKNEVPTWSEITAFEASGFSEGELDMHLVSEDMIFVANWLAQNQYVKILTMEEFGELDADHRIEVLSTDEVIICNGTLLKSDIIAYESN